MATSSVTTVRPITIPRRSILNPSGYKRMMRKLFRVDEPPKRVTGVPYSFHALHEWRQEYKATRPIAFYFAETVPSYFTRIKGMWGDFTYTVSDTYDNYFIRRTDKYDTGFKRHEFNTPDETMLPAMFNQLAAHVESTYSKRWLNWKSTRLPRTERDNDPDVKYWKKIRRNAEWGEIFKRKLYRNKEYAIAMMHEILSRQYESPIDEDELEEFKNMLETFTLYMWWTVVRPARKEADAESGLDAIRERFDAKYGTHEWSYSNLDADEQHEYSEIISISTELNRTREDEDTEMMCRLVKARQNIWD